MTHRIRFTPINEQAVPTCWNCGRPVEGPTEATFIYRQPAFALVDRWRRCSCGAYQNVQAPHNITIEAYERKDRNAS
jgi:hypothetical protein